MGIKLKGLLTEQYLVPLKIVTVYVLWKLFHHFAWLPGTALNQHWKVLVFKLGSYYALATGFILSLSGMSASSSGININMLASNKQIWVQEHCLGIPAMVVFTGSIMLFNGSLKDKLRFILIGLAGIIVVNIIRLIFVCLAWVYLSDYFFRINHSVIYVIAMYGFIFLMVAWWMNRNTISQQSIKRI